jgi:hypothetical protein
MTMASFCHLLFKVMFYAVFCVLRKPDFRFKTYGISGWFDMPVAHGGDLHHEDEKSKPIKMLAITFDERRHYHSQVLDGLMILLGTTGRLAAGLTIRVTLESTRRGRAAILVDRRIASSC